MVSVLERAENQFSFWGLCLAHLKQRRCYILIFNFSVMLNKEKNTESPVQTINEPHLTYGANLIIDLHVLAVQTNQHFVLSKKFKKLAYSLANEIANLEPKCVTLNIV